MALTAGVRLGPYEVTAQIGKGGMGEVYRARDTKLDRQVALKILPDVFASDRDRLARFEREAKTLAALNHPHIAHIHGFEQREGISALVMELVEGEDLSDRIARSPIPFDEAVPIARQIAEALAAAHDQGIVHRDLKPANIKVRPDGVVKVLDFGLAKALEPTSIAAVDGTASPTMTSPAVMTGFGILLGTAAYMSPEQARGRPADTRSDIWAFGCVLYEMLTGRRAFDGEEVSDTLAAVLRGEPHWSALPADAPPSITILLRGCLRKDRSQRIADISTVLFVLDEPALREVASVAAGPVAPPPLWRRVIPFAVTAMVAGLVVGGVTWGLRSSAVEPSVTHLSFPLPAGQQFTNLGRPLVAMSPDGTRIVYVANNRLYMRSIAEREPRAIPGTEDPLGVTSPTFSPDGESIAFVSATESLLKKIPAAGGLAIALCTIQNSMGLSWGRDGIVFGQRFGDIMRVSPDGGTPVTLVKVGENETLSRPSVLPGGRAVLFTVGVGFGLEAGTGAVDSGMWDQANIVVQMLPSGERRTLVERATDGRFLPTGHLVYARGGSLLAAPFDLEALQLTGAAAPIVEGVRRGDATGVAQFSVSDTGTLAYLPGSTSPNLRRLALSDRQGHLEVLEVPPGAYESVRVSPDERRLAVGINDGQRSNIWIHDLTRTSAPRQLTLEGRNRFPVWSPDSRDVAFQSDRGGELAVFRQHADGSRAAERLTTPEQGATHVPWSWSADGTTLLFSVRRSSGPPESLWTLSLPVRTVASLGVESATEISGAFSPDGRWFAYESADEPRRAASVFVEPLPRTGARYRVSNGRRPMWSSDGAELLFAHGGPGQIVATRVTTRPAFTFAAPSPAFGGSAGASRGPFKTFGPGSPLPYDVMPDRKRVAGVIEADAISLTPEVEVVLGWFQELRRLAPAN